MPFFMVAFFSISSWTGHENWSEIPYDYLFKNNVLLFSRTIYNCFTYCFGIFCNLIIPKESIEMQIFPLKMGTSPSTYIQMPPPPPRISFTDPFYAVLGKNCHWFRMSFVCWTFASLMPIVLSVIWSHDQMQPMSQSRADR